ncbi:MAG: hypothetical protein EBS01_08540 [Verrucomicrobia bacterium]|nr:hypothetical protein [Verrucomicrobiota bacterium]
MEPSARHTWTDPKQSAAAVAQLLPELDRTPGDEEMLTDSFHQISLAPDYAGGLRDGISNEQLSDLFACLMTLK